jgi:hypothetical protein
VTDIIGDDAEAELQSGRGDQEILESDGYALRGSLAFDAAS